MCHAGLSDVLKSRSESAASETVCFCEVVTYLQLPPLRRVIAFGFFSIASPSRILLHIIIIRCVLLTQYCAGDKIEKNKMGWACGAYG